MNFSILLYTSFKISDETTGYNGQTIAVTDKIRRWDNTITHFFDFYCL